MEDHLLAIDFLPPREIVGGVIDQIAADVVAEHLPHPGHRHHC
jgi:hypothetical protein